MNEKLPFSDPIDFIECPSVRFAIGNRFKYFIHVTDFNNLNSIRDNGLIPNKNLKYDSTIPESYLGEKYEGILCLHPFGAEIWPRQTSNEIVYEFSVSLAISNKYLPRKIGIDLSYYREAEPGSWWGFSAADISMNLANRRGSIASYESIPPDLIQVFSNQSSPSDPNTWPFLRYTEDAQIFKRPVA